MSIMVTLLSLKSTFRVLKITKIIFKTVKVWLAKNIKALFFAIPNLLLALIIGGSVAFGIGYISFGSVDFVDELFGDFLRHYLEKTIPLDVKEQHALSEIKRNSYLLFFAIFASGLAIWARISQQVQILQTQKQIDQTKEQIDNSSVINRNDRFAKAVEMLGKDKAGTSHRGGLYMLRDLIQENSKTEYIRCIQIIAEWLVESKSSAPLREAAMNVFSGIETKDLSPESLREIIEEYKKEIELPYWPDFQKANFSNIHLMEANFESVILAGANFEGALVEGVNFKNAIVAHAEMKNAKKLTVKQITEAKWQNNEGTGKPPTLPEDLAKTPEDKKLLDDWLELSNQR